MPNFLNFINKKQHLKVIDGKHCKLGRWKPDFTDINRHFINEHLIDKLQQIKTISWSN